MVYLCLNVVPGHHVIRLVGRMKQGSSSGQKLWCQVGGESSALGRFPRWDASTEWCDILWFARRSHVECYYSLRPYSIPSNCVCCLGCTQVRRRGEGLQAAHSKSRSGSSAKHVLGWQYLPLRSQHGVCFLRVGFPCQSFRHLRSILYLSHAQMIC